MTSSTASFSSGSRLSPAASINHSESSSSSSSSVAQLDQLRHLGCQCHQTGLLAGVKLVLLSPQLGQECRQADLTAGPALLTCEPNLPTWPEMLLCTVVGGPHRFPFFYLKDLSLQLCSGYTFNQ